MHPASSSTSPAVTVVVAAYNCAKWIDLTVGDVLSQTFADFELIVVDDGSTDATAEKIRSIADPRVRYVHQANSGSPAKPRNTGLGLARGGYITFLDHDDRWRRNRLEKIMHCFSRMPDVDVVTHDENVVSEGKTIAVNRYGPASPRLYLDMLLTGNRFSPSATTLRTEVVRRHNGFDERREFISVEDFDLWLRLAKSGCRYHFLKEVLGDYIYNGANLTSNVDLHHLRRSHLINWHLQTEADLLDRFRNRILGFGDYVYARDLHAQRKFGPASSKYLAALKKGYWSPKLLAGLGLSSLRIKA